MKIKNSLLIFFLLNIVSIDICYAHKKYTFFSRVIIWGHPLHSNTFSYVHLAWYRAFEYLGYEVYWINSQKELNGIELNNTLFITEGQVDSDMPCRDDCYYVLHNCNYDRYKELFEKNRCISLQVYTHDCLKYATQKFDECIYGNSDAKILFMPWATDLLPYEIDEIKKQLIKGKKENYIYWVGSIGAGTFGNSKQIEPFEKACYENNINLLHIVNQSMHDAIAAIKKSYMAPAIQGEWQCEVGYIPCRIFKNISYGQWGITNNKTVYDLFEGKITYNSDTYQLFYDAKHKIETMQMTELYELMDFVKTKHTYVNRIELLLMFIVHSLIAS